MTFDQWWATLETREQHRADKALTEEAFEAGRQAEREECAMEAEYYIKHSTVAKNIAEDIRARRTK